MIASEYLSQVIAAVQQTPPAVTVARTMLKYFITRLHLIIDISGIIYPVKFSSVDYLGAKSSHSSFQFIVGRTHILYKLASFNSGAFGT